jgi:hypothetical protein
MNAEFRSGNLLRKWKRINIQLGLREKSFENGGRIEVTQNTDICGVRNFKFCHWK